ncbi:Protein of unknown function DUF1517 [Dillenia turbinata]|uniref:DUF1517 domain-containing protein n=2 Tax=Magnoliopsida TaxID=3398 RepID=A0AAN8U752_9MAGN
MATTSILESNPFSIHSKPLKWNPLFHKPCLIPLRSSNPPKTLKFYSIGPKKIMGFPKNFVRCMSTNYSTKNQENPSNAFERIVKIIVKTLKALQKPSIAVVLLGLLLTYDPSNALAASGGRMGGNSFSSRSSSSSSSRSYSYSGSPRISYSAPYFAPSPFGGVPGGVYVGPAPAVGIGVGGSSFILLMMGFAAFILVSGFLSDRSGDSVITATGKTSVLKLQVGLLGLGKSLQRDLNRIAETADTSTSEGLSYVLTETTLALLRHPDYCISGYSSVDVKRSMEEGEKRFNQLSIEERGKFDEETLVNVNSIKRQSTSGQRAGGFSNDYIVITILVAAEGVHKLPAINGSKDLKGALQKLASIPAREMLAVEVLWTPQNENDTLSERELLQDYPLLRPL